MLMIDSAINKERPRFIPPMRTIATPLLVALIVLCASRSTSAEDVVCYKCNSYTNAECKGNSLDAFKTTCAPDNGGCLKMQFFFDAKGNGEIEERVVRDCAMTMPKPMCSKGFGASGKRFRRVVCHCKGELCNTAPSAKVSFSAHTFMALLVNGLILFAQYG